METTNNITDLKDLSMALFMGAALKTDQGNDQAAKRNKRIVSLFSKPISQVNKSFFKQKMEDKLDQDYRQYIQEIPDNQEPYIDSFGRCTYFIVKLGGQTLPIYQPGSVMFETAVNGDSECSVVAGGSQQNGPILGNGCAIFLAKFLGKMVTKYTATCEQENYESSFFHPNVYKYALEQTLLNCSFEDMKEHGRLLLLKEKLMNMADKDTQRDFKLLSLFQLKDFCRQNIDIEQQVQNNIEDYQISQQDALRAMQYRQQNMVFPTAKLIQQGGDNIDQSIEKMKNAILKKDGIVDADSKADFNFFVSNCININALDSMGVLEQEKTVNQYEPSIFRKETMKVKSHKSIEQIEPPKLGAKKRSGSVQHDELPKQFSRVQGSGSALNIPSYDDIASSGSVEKGEFLTDNELYFLQHLATNEALQEYHSALEEGLCSLFIQAKISDGKYKIDGATDLSDGLQLAGEVIPEVGGILSKFGQLMEAKEENSIKEKLGKISKLIPDSMRNLISKFISAKLTIKRRTFISGLTMDEIKYSTSNYDKLKMVFSNDCTQYTLKAAMDIKIIEAYILLMNTQEIQHIIMNENFAEEFSGMVVQSFMGDVKYKQIDHALFDNEKPSEFQIEKRFTMVDSYFTHPMHALPQLLKKLQNETCEKNEERVKRYLLVCDDTNFVNIANIIDPSKEIQMGFFNMYNEVTEERLSRQKQDTKEKKTCIIF